MAMAFAPASKVPIIIENAEVVSKSYPDFFGKTWEEQSLKFCKLNFTLVPLRLCGGTTFKNKHANT
jgi:hypothetical protein